MCECLIKILLIVALVVETLCIGNLCLNSKSNNTCVCYVKSGYYRQKSSVLKIADCRYINLNYFPVSVELEPNLHQLDLSYNELEKLEQTNDVMPYQNLVILDVSHNAINYVHADFFEDKSNLIELNLSYNNITSFENANIFLTLNKLKYLDLSFNRIQVVEAIFSPLKQLEFLELSYNDLEHVFSDNKKTLKEALSLSGSLKDLRMNHLGIKEINNRFFQGLTNVTHLSLADNFLEAVPLVPHNVQYLDLSGNEITEITPKDFNYISLKHLKLNRLTKLDSVQRYSFYHLPALETLSIRNCKKLKRLNSDVFGAITPEYETSLKKLYLSNNALRTLNESYSYLIRQLHYVNLNGNPWHCDCSLLWMTPLRYMMFRSYNMRCTSPAHLANRKLFELEDSELPDCYPEKYGKRIHRILIPLLIALVIMLCMLIIYLLYYAPTYMRKPRIIGPTSPYSQVVMHDDL